MKNRSWFQVYPGNSRATRLSMVAGGFKMLCWLLLAAAVLCSLPLVVVGYSMATAAGIPRALFFLMDDWDDLALAALALWCSFGLCLCILTTLRGQERLCADPDRSASASGSQALAVLGGCVKVLSWLLLIAAVLCSLFLLAAGYAAMSYRGLARALMFLADDWDELCLATLVLWGAFVLCRYVLSALRAHGTLGDPSLEEQHQA